MVEIAIPTHKNWSDLKKLYGVADGAVSGIDIGKALDTYHKSVGPNMSQAAIQKNGEAAEKLEKMLAGYIGKLDKKKVKKDYPKFQKLFLDDYVGAAHHKKEEFKREAADTATFQKELQTFIGMVTRMSDLLVHEEDLKKFNDGPLAAFAKVCAGAKIHIGKISQNVTMMQAEIKGSRRDSLQQTRHTIMELTHMIADEAKKEGLA